MAKDDIDELERRKQELEVELGELHAILDDSLDRVRTDVRSKLDVKAYIRRYPLQLAGAAAFLGFLLGQRRQSSKPKDESSSSHATNNENPLVQELKKLASKKAVALASQFIEGKIQEAKKENA